MSKRLVRQPLHSKFSSIGKVRSLCICKTTINLVLLISISLRVFITSFSAVSVLWHSSVTRGMAVNVTPRADPGGGGLVIPILR